MDLWKSGLSDLLLVLASMVLVFGAADGKAILKQQFSYEKFDDRDHGQFAFLGGSSSIDGGALQLTSDSLNDAVKIPNNTGRIIYHQPFKLWHINKDGNDIVASFKSFFRINIFRNREWNAGEGLAFLIAPTSDYIPDQSWGQWMGLTNATTDGDPRNQIVAIEFDTEKQDFDPDDNHIGLNINSIVSKKVVPLKESGIVLSPEVGTDYSIGVWVEYDGISKLLQVYMSKNKDPKPNKPLLQEEINLKDYVKQESYFGFAASTGSPEIQLNCVLEWKLELEDFPENKNWTWLKILAGVGIPVLTIAILLGIRLYVVYMRKRRKNRDEESNVQGTLKRLPGMPREFKYKELKRATNNFHESMILGDGGFGVVYKGILHEKDSEGTASTTSRTAIAVKKFSRDSIKSKSDFLDELTIIHRLRHRHLVRLEGWCYEKGKLFLVYDFMPNGSLENHLYGVPGQNTLNWRYRYKILVGVASALHYLHNEYDQKVLHRDIKSSNILLDSDFNARLGDFGLARALDHERNSYADLNIGGVAGTMGYVAPECFHEGRATPESDVYGFGAVVLEVVCGRRPGVSVEHEQSQYTLVDWVWKLHRDELIEKALDKQLEDDVVADEARRLLLLGLACSHPVASERPETQAILQILSGALPAPHVPPFKPSFIWPPMSSSTSTTTTSLLSTNNSVP